LPVYHIIGRLIYNLTIEKAIKYATPALEGGLQAYLERPKRIKLIFTQLLLLIMS